MDNVLKQLGFNSLTEVQEKILNLKSNKNILILSSCGSGKTEGAFNWIVNTNKKTIVVQAMKTLANGIYNRLNDYNKQLSLNNWTIQHSSIQNDKLLKNKYCVTTIDQVLSGWLGLGKQAFIKGKNIISSNFVFDEVQLFDPSKTFLTTLNMLDTTYKENNQNFIIMTATMPEYLIKFLKDRYDMEIVISENEAVKNRSVSISYSENIDYNAINTYSNKQIIVCNTRDQQEDIFMNINDKNRCIILNSKLLTTDRIKVENQVYKYFGKNSKNNNKILITTQIVEAGIDISADKVLSVSAPIDNLIQRCGRCSRWGGDGEFKVFNMEDKVYDINVVNKTICKIKSNNNIAFTWEIQKQWVNEILNDYYKKYINKMELKKNKIKLKLNKRNELIRDIKNINIIVVNTLFGVNRDMFKKDTVSININNLKRLKGNELYILDKKQIQKVNYNDIEIGNTVLISNENCLYNQLGFKIEEGSQCIEFPDIDTLDDTLNNIYTDYIEEPWISHAVLTRDIIKQKLHNFKYIDYINKNLDYISLISGLHDLGKLDMAWVKWSNGKNTPLAHFPFTKKPYTYKNRNHKNISAYVLKNYCDKIMFNVLIQHHKREILINKNIYIEEFKLHKDTNSILHRYGFENNIKTEDENIKINENDIITPADKEWNIFLYIVGSLMESDIESINTYLENHKNVA